MMVVYVELYLRSSKLQLMTARTRSSRFPRMSNPKAPLKHCSANGLLCIRGPHPWKISSSRSSQGTTSRYTQRRSVLERRRRWNGDVQNPARRKAILSLGVSGRWRETVGCSLPVSPRCPRIHEVLTDGSICLGGDPRRVADGRREVYSGRGEFRRTRLPAKVDSYR